MANFITLHNMRDAEMDINFDLIESFGVISDKAYQYCQKQYHGYTYVVPLGLLEQDFPYIVKETPEEIRRLLKGEK